MALYGERGFESTTVAEIAERAGLTERTFFRHFADKREVLFSGAGAMKELLVGTVAEAPESSAPIDAAAAGLEASVSTLAFGARSSIGADWAISVRSASWSSSGRYEPVSTWRWRSVAE